ncbi:MAG: nicotinate-nucleotide adenylyltransferase [Roseburia sp.]|nr:nicotinate-nucleotide adenylyltransferase [Roseburia sp.]MCM1098092.1 nicotinate-nucleotide adenylyltransferase [Ruminococcus flavefaciens]
MRRQIGILGGAFNPVHIGHLLLAEQAADYLGLDEVWMMPTGISPEKAGSSPDRLSGEERLYLTELAVRDNDRLRCSDQEVRRDGYTYTYETMEELAEKFPEAKFYFLLGADCLFSLEKWRHPERILKSCSLAAAVRNDVPWEAMEEKRDELLAKFGGEICLLPSAQIPVSSTEIRERIRTGRSIRYLTPEPVWAYIMERGLYRESGKVFEKAEKENQKGTGRQKV